MKKVFFAFFVASFVLLGGGRVEAGRPVCGDGKCSGGETTATCQQDCPPPICNFDGICNPGETCESCPNDCGTTGKGKNKLCCGKNGYCDALVCGNHDTDTTADCQDYCPTDGGKIIAGICGCGVPDTDTDGDGTLDCNDGCPNDPKKTEPGIAGCGYEEPVNGAVQESRALILTQEGVSFTVPATVLPTGVTVTLSEQAVTSTDFVPAANETPITDVIKLNFSESKPTKMQMTLRVQIPDSVGPHFYGYVKVVGAPPFGSEFTGTTGWSLAIGKFDPLTKVLSFPFHTTAQEIFLIVVEKAAAGAARSEDSKFLLAAKDFVHEALRKGGKILGNLFLSEAFAAEAVCGDGVIDEEGWEDCEDGNTLGGDGCDSICQSEAITVAYWQLAEWAVICDPPLDPLGSSCGAVEGLAQRFKAATQKIASFGFDEAAVSRVARADLERLGHPFGTSDGGSSDAYLIAHLVPDGSLGDRVLGQYFAGDHKLSVVESVLSEDVSLKRNSVAHELFHAVQWDEIPWVRSDWIIEGTAVAVEVATVTDSYEARRMHRWGGQWRRWGYTLNSTEGNDPYKTVEFWFELADGDISYLKELFVTLDNATGAGLTPPVYINGSNDYPFVDAALALLSIVPDIDPNLSALPDAYLDLILVRDSQPEYPHCNQASCTIGQDCAAITGARANMTAVCSDLEILADPACPGPIGTKQITLQVTANDPNAWKLLLDGTLYPPNTAISFENNNPHLWVINAELDPNASTSVTLQIISDDYPQCICGDGRLDTGEACDDGNVANGDGCDASCLIEVAVCGDGRVDAGEACDDGNTVAGDGCDASCQIEVPVAVCGDGVCSEGETPGSCPQECYQCGDSVCTAPYENETTCSADCLEKPTVCPGTNGYYDDPDPTATCTRYAIQCLCFKSTGCSWFYSVDSPDVDDCCDGYNAVNGETGHVYQSYIAPHLTTYSGTTLNGYGCMVDIGEPVACKGSGIVSFTETFCKSGSGGTSIPLGKSPNCPDTEAPYYTDDAYICLPWDAVTP